ncbi:unnamed protein product [marine sediment metagenome]|uniref:Uncharacterized protein n=1 Tax=marine sediment metagenome TaxID=412755 RepID=X1GI55_9ZZZZ
MKNDKKKEKSKLIDDKIEEILEATWKNWASRRKCEQTHTPEYIKREKKEKNHIK